MSIAPHLESAIEKIALEWLEEASWRNRNSQVTTTNEFLMEVERIFFATKQEFETHRPTQPQGRSLVGNARVSALHRLIDRDGSDCAYCRCDLYELGFTIDHVVPVLRGGSDDDSNLVLACRSCNSRKGTRSRAEFQAEML